jgi:hypothetical protein
VILRNIAAHLSIVVQQRGSWGVRLLSITATFYLVRPLSPDLASATVAKVAARGCAQYDCAFINSGLEAGGTAE